MSVTAVKEVSLVLVSYVDKDGKEITQLAVVGDRNVNLLNNDKLGFGKETPQGPAVHWIKDGVLKLMKRVSS